MQPSEEDIAWFKSTFHPVPKPTLPEDCIEYSIHLVSANFTLDNDSELRLQLREVQKYANDLLKQWLKGYIWQRQGFTLELAKEDGLSFLRGRTEYGDSIEDEWVIVWILRELTKKFGSIWVKLTDSDGEFLLIEASGTIPEWLEPEVAENRVWINDGQLKIIKPANASRSSKRTSEKLSFHDAREIILNEPKRIMNSTSIEEEAFYRLRNYPAQIADNMHYALVSLPRRVAFLLMQRPAYISPAIEAFYLRDPIALKPLQQGNGAELRFPPEDIVTVSIKVPRVGYAQVRSQDFPAPPVWKNQMPSTSDSKAYARTNTGMKVTCGFEMLLSDPQYQDKQPVREMKMILDDLETGDETLPSDETIKEQGNREDDEKWLDINFDDLEHELRNKNRQDAGKKPEFGDKAAQENLQRIVKQFEDFLNKDGGVTQDNGMFDDSSELEDEDDDNNVTEDEDSDDGEDKEASFDEGEFTKMMQEMMGMPADVMKEIMGGTIDALSEGSAAKVPREVRERAMTKIEEIDSSDEDVEDLHQMESELRASGALNLNTRSHGEETSRQLRHKSDVEGPEDDQGLNDFDADFARNILQSFKSSGGTGGPAASLMSMMNNSGSGEGGSSSNSIRKPTK